MAVIDMAIIDAEALLGSMANMIDAYEELKGIYKKEDRYDAVVKIENQIEGLQMAERVICSYAYGKDKKEAEKEIGSIPIKYIESEKERISKMVREEAELGRPERAEKLSNSMATLEALISNWLYYTGADWREGI